MRAKQGDSLLAGRLADALQRRVDDCQCGEEDDSTWCVWCAEDTGLLASLDRGSDPLICPRCNKPVVDFDAPPAETGTTCNPINSPKCWRPSPLRVQLDEYDYIRTAMRR